VTGERLRKLRVRLDMSQEGLARLLGISFATVNRWETIEGATGPRGTILSVLTALEEGLRRDPMLPGHLASWSQQGQPYLLQRLFNLAYGPDPRKASR
jgi:transcriptional regulator with XRE-family HTH domain